MNKKPVSIKLNFASKDDAHEWVAGLLDGWGENGPFSTRWADGKTAWNMHDLDIEVWSEGADE